MIRKQSNACTHTHTQRANEQSSFCVCGQTKTIQTLNAGAQKKTDFGPMGPFMKALNLEAMIVLMIVVLVVMILIVMVRVVADDEEFVEARVSQQRRPK